MLGSLQTHFWAVRDYLSPVLLNSKFKETGRLTPDEFVAAGDYLVYKFPTWRWEAGEPGKTREFLPSDKQYLVSRNVPCLRRVSQLAYANGVDEDSETMLSFALDSNTSGSDGDEEWVATHTSKDPSAPRPVATIGDIPDLDSLHLSPTSSSPTKSAPVGKPEEMPDMDDIPDMSDSEDDMAGGLVEEEDEAVVVVPVSSTSGAKSDNLIQVRTYDCSITYDKYYQTPRMWLLGYDEHKSPLPPTSALEDVSSDHALKTVTIEPFPHSSLSMASVHPCKHSSVMKKFIERMDRGVVEAQRKERERERSTSSTSSGGEGKEGKVVGKKSGWKKLVSGGGKEKEKEREREREKEGEEQQEGPEGLRVDQYLVVFLKFMSSIVPTIEVDATNSI